jgi:hypothetical protein
MNEVTWDDTPCTNGHIATYSSSNTIPAGGVRCQCGRYETKVIYLQDGKTKLELVPVESEAKK